MEAVEGIVFPVWENINTGRFLGSFGLHSTICERWKSHYEAQSGWGAVKTVCQEKLRAVFYRD